MRRLKGTGISIVNDLSPEERIQQGVLRRHLVESRRQSFNAVIRNNSLVINGEQYSVRQLQNLSDSEVVNDTVNKTEVGAPCVPTAPLVTSRGDTGITTVIAGVNKVLLPKCKANSAGVFQNNSTPKDGSRAPVIQQFARAKGGNTHGVITRSNSTGSGGGKSKVK